MKNLYQTVMRKAKEFMNKPVGTLELLLFTGGVAGGLALSATGATAAELEQEQVNFGDTKGKTEETRAVSGFVTLDYASKYMFRGVPYSEEPVFQAVGGVALANEVANLSVIGFVNYDTQTEQINEADVSLEASRSVGKANLTAGITHLEFPDTGLPSTDEVYARIGLDTFLNPEFFVAQDYVDGKGTYLEGSVSHNLPLGIEASASLGYNDHQFREDSGFSHAVLGFARPFSTESGSFTLKPYVNVQRAIADDFEDEVWGGVVAEVGW
ncbi:MAG: hypothetical protein ABIE22_02470 [archaeon]